MGFKVTYYRVRCTFTKIISKLRLMYAYVMLKNKNTRSF